MSADKSKARNTHRICECVGQCELTQWCFHTAVDTLCRWLPFWNNPEAGFAVLQWKRRILSSGNVNTSYYNKLLGWMNCDRVLQFITPSYRQILAVDCRAQSWPAAGRPKKLVWCWKRRGGPSWLFLSPGCPLAVWHQEGNRVLQSQYFLLRIKVRSIDG